MAESTQAGSDGVAGGGRVLGDIAAPRERGQNAVHGCLADAEVTGQVGDTALRHPVVQGFENL